MIKSMKIEKQDYLQVFKLEKVNVKDREFQKVTHSQEQPEYENTVFVPVGAGNAVETKAYVIDDYEYCTMLLAEEY